MRKGAQHLEPDTAPTLVKTYFVGTGTLAHKAGDDAAKNLKPPPNGGCVLSALAHQQFLTTHCAVRKQQACLTNSCARSAFTGCAAGLFTAVL